MAKGKSTWKYNKLLTARRNYFDGGGAKGNIFQNAGSDIKTAFTNPGAALSGLSSGAGTFGMTSMLGAAAGAIGDIGGKLLSNGLESKAGGIVSGVGDALGGIPIIGGFAKGALNLVGGGINALFGSKLNQANINAANADIARMNSSATADAASFDALGQKMASTAGRAIHGKSFYGRDGVFSNKAGKIQRELEEEARVASKRQALALVDNAENLSSDQLVGMEANYAAFGGPLGFDGGAIGFDFMNRYIKAKEAAAEGKDNSITSMPNSFAFGGSTHGADFTNGMVFIGNGGSHEQNPFEGVPMGVDDSGTPNLVEEGETIFNDYVFSKRIAVPKAIRDKYKLRGTKGISFAEASRQLAKESEERPNDPISERGMQALMADLANAQEELKSMKQNGKFAYGGKVNKYDGATEATQQMNTGWTPSKINTYGYIKDGYYGLGDTPFWIENGNYTEPYKDFITNKYNIDSFRQHLKSQFDFYDNATDEQKKSNRYKAIQLFIDRNKDWYDNRGTIDSWNIDGDLMEKAKSYALSKPGFMHPEDIARAALSEKPTKPTEAKRYFTYGTTDPLDYFEGRNEKGQTWFDLNPGYSFVDRKGTVRDPVDVGGVSTIYTDYYLKKADTETPKVEEEDEGPLDLPGANPLRYVPAIGLGIGTITDSLGLTNKPDYSNADAILEATRSGGTYQPVEFNPIGNYLTYRPFDRDYYLNKMSAEAGATRRALLQNAGMNRGAGMAAILAADNNAQNQVGSLARQAEEYNLAQRHQVEDFNRSTNITNSQGMLQADIANQKAQAELRNFSLKGTLAAAEMKERARMAADQAKSNNISGFLQSLGDIGYEAENRAWRNWAAEHGIFGPIRGKKKSNTTKSTSNKTGKKSTETPEIIPGDILYDGPLYAAKGGKLKRVKRKRGLTF